MISPLFTTLPLSFSSPAPAPTYSPETMLPKDHTAAPRNSHSLLNQDNRIQLKPHEEICLCLGILSIALKISRTISQTRTVLTTTTNYQLAFPQQRYRRSKICMRSMFSSSSCHFYPKRPLRTPSRAGVDPRRRTGVAGSVISHFLSC